MFYYVLFLFLEKPQKSFDDLFGEPNTKKNVLSDEDSNDDFNMSSESDDDFVPKSGMF